LKDEGGVEEVVEPGGRSIETGEPVAGFAGAPDEGTGLTVKAGLALETDFPPGLCSRRIDWVPAAGEAGFGVGVDVLEVGEVNEMDPELLFANGEDAGAFDVVLALAGGRLAERRLVCEGDDMLEVVVVLTVTAGPWLLLAAGLLVGLKVGRLSAACLMRFRKFIFG
jgi:hypothetical protein